MSTSVIVPYGGHDPDRAQALRHVLDFYRYEFPDWQVIVADQDSADSYTFSRARAVNDGAAKADGDVLVIQDADSLCAPGNVAVAVAMARTEPGMVRAYTRYRRLSRPATGSFETYKQALACADADVEWQQDPAFAHGCAAIQRSCFEAVGGYDPKFTGWGYEDMALEAVCNAHWPDRRVVGDLVHLWHPAAWGGADDRRNSDLYYRLYEPRKGDPVGLIAARYTLPEFAG